MDEEDPSPSPLSPSRVHRLTFDRRQSASVYLYVAAQRGQVRLAAEYSGCGPSAGRHSPCGVIHQDAFTLHATLVLASVTVTPAVQHGNRTTRTTPEILWPHIARSAPDEDHHRAVAAAIRTPPSDWKRPPRRPDHTGLRAIESDLRPLNIGHSYA